MGAHPMAEAFIGNSRALALWERLVLDGPGASRPSPEKIFTACPGTRRLFTTYAIVDEGLHAERGGCGTGRGAAPANHRHKGPLFTAHSERDA